MGVVSSLTWGFVVYGTVWVRICRGGWSVSGIVLGMFCRGDKVYEYLSLVESRVGHRTLLRLGEVTNVAGTSYTHANPDGDSNYYWRCRLQQFRVFSGRLWAVWQPGNHGRDSHQRRRQPATSGTVPALLCRGTRSATLTITTCTTTTSSASACTVRRGSASFCEELATNVAGTSYTHANPDGDSNYYWVVACNSSGCSAVDSSNPATTVGSPA